MHFTTRLCFILSPFAAVLILALALDAATVNQTLLRATSPFEDVVEFALITNTASMNKALAAVDKSAAAVKAVLSAPAAIKFGSLVQGIHHSATNNKLHAVAENAVEAFRLLIDNLQSEGLKEPLEVSLLDYAGFKLQVLATSEQPDWMDLDLVDLLEAHFRRKR